MSCGSDFYTSNCVCDTLLCIVEAQEKIAPSETADCQFGCKSSIDQLLSPSQTGNDTIPVLLVCKNSCLPFVGVGVNTSDTAGTLQAVTSPIFRVVDVDPETCCATLEILLPAGATPVEDVVLDPEILLDDFLGIDSYERTRTCITVDLNCFCAVTCLPPTSVL